MIHTLEVDSIQLGFNDRKILSDIYLRWRPGKLQACWEEMDQVNPV